MTQLQGADPPDPYGGLRLLGSALAFVAATIFYIRWNDLWFRQHAEEEFRLKRLELDIDRASWVVETALEWMSEKGEPLPTALVDRLTARLFEPGAASEGARHPAEDVAATLLNAAGLKMQVPGVGEVTYDRHGLKRLQEAAGKSE